MEAFGREFFSALAFVILIAGGVFVGTKVYTASCGGGGQA